MTTPVRPPAFLQTTEPPRPPVFIHAGPGWFKLQCCWCSIPTEPVYIKVRAIIAWIPHEDGVEAVCADSHDLGNNEPTLADPACAIQAPDGSVIGDHDAEFANRDEWVRDHAVPFIAKQEKRIQEANAARSQKRKNKK